MEQKPPYDKTQGSGMASNDVHYIPAESKTFYEPTGMAMDDEDLELDLDLDMDLDMELDMEVEQEEMEPGGGESLRGYEDRGEDVFFRPCEEFKDVTLQNVHLGGEGRVLKVKVRLCDVCRGRRIRLAVLLYEKACFEKKLCGLKVAEVTVPGCHGCKRKLTVGDFFFVLPEDNICSSEREVSVQVIAHYSSFPQDMPPC